MVTRRIPESSTWQLVLLYLSKPLIVGLINLALVLIIGAVLQRLQVVTMLTGGQPLPDFDAYYEIVRQVWLGNHPYRISTMQTLGPPLVIVPFLPFGLISIELGRSFLTLLSLGSVGATGWRLAGTWTKNHRSRLTGSLVLVVILLTSFPARFTLSMGQPNLIIAWLVTLFLTTDNQFKRGASLALAAIIKTFYGFPALSLLRFDGKSWVSFCLVFGSVLLLSLPWIRPHYYLDFATQNFVSLVTSTQPAVDMDYYNQSLKSTFGRFNAIDFYQPAMVGFLSVSSLYLLMRKNYPAAIVLSLILSPVIWIHYFVVLFPVIVGLGAIVKEGYYPLRPKLFLSLVLFVASYLWWTEFPWIHQASKNIFTALLASHYLISAGLVLGLCVGMEHTLPHGLNFLVTQNGTKKDTH
ncbi:MAG TPA: glycosyltransferase family 87 protein [Vitreimonas sp.]|nr:glycosyltransferase family 87 protein [Vitreimonas sp.]